MVNQLVEIQGMRDERCKSIVHFSRRSSVYIMPMQKISDSLRIASCGDVVKLDDLCSAQGRHESPTTLLARIMHTGSMSYS